MRRMKRLLAVLLAAVMVMTMGSMSVLADDASDGKYCIYIQGADSDSYSFDAYMIFSGQTTSGVLANVVWGSGVDTTTYTETAILAAIMQITVDNSTYPFASVSSAADVAAILTNYTDDSDIVIAFSEVINNYLVSSPTGTSSTVTKVSDTSYTYTISGLNGGYYLVKDSSSSNVSAYTKYMLVTAGAETGTTYNVITLKTSYPTVAKTADVDTVSIGDTVTYTLTGKVPTMTYYDTYQYIFTDSLSSGLTYTTSSLKVYGVTSLSAEVEITNGYTLTVKEETDGTTTITVSFANLKTVTDISTYAYIEVVYKATLDSDAVVGTTTTASNLNSVRLTYSNNPNSSTSTNTIAATAYVTTLKLKITKVDASNQTKTLGGAVFELYYLDGATPMYALVDSSGALTGWTNTESAIGTTTYPMTELVTGSDGTITITGLGEGIYYIMERKAADGYNVDVTPWQITISADVDQATGYLTSLTTTEASTPTIYTMTSASEADGTVYVTVTNSKNGTLPTTGGIGTTIFYVVGTILVIGAAVILITRRRMADRT